MIGDKIRGYFSNRQSTRARLCIIEHCHSLIAPAEIEEQPTILLPNSQGSQNTARSIRRAESHCIARKFPSFDKL
ncbi:hypothetical protein [Bradyrhizobium sp. AZCC 1721]|uniref:hypothetical protein n=1 Tax=Bradyrhizobium sp. AZCC 1721 TaxID=3117016 RepID=UPI002FF2B90B